MKKTLALLTALALCLGLAGCVPRQTGYKVVMPDGAPALAFASLMATDAEIDGRKFSYTVVPAAAIGDYAARGETDFAVLPTNAAVNLVKNGADYRMTAVSTYGNLYFTTKDEVSSLAALKGKVLASIGRGQVPALVLKAVLTKLDIPFVESDTVKDADTVSIRYAADGPAAIALVKAGTASACLLAEPAATGSLGQIEGASLFDMQQIYARAFEVEGGFPQACLVARKAVPDKIVDALLKALDGNAVWCEANPEAAVTAISSHMADGSAASIKKLTPAIVERCNLVNKRAAKVKSEVITFLTALGAPLPDDGFFYGI